MTAGDEPLIRAELSIQRRSQRFVLKDLAFTQQYSHVYFARLRQLKAVAERQLIEKWSAGVPPPAQRRVLGLQASDAPDSVGVSSAPQGPPVCVIGTLFKNMPKYMRFLQEYTKELVRLEAGEEDEGDDDAIVTEESTVGADALAAAAASSASLVSDGDTVVLEDESGRVELTGGAMPPVAEVTTGMVVAVAGWLRAKGKFEVCAWAFAEPLPPTPRALVPAAVPQYVGILCGLELSGGGVLPSGLDLLVDYLSGNCGGSTATTTASRIGRLVIAGNLTGWTEELRLKQKIRLEPSDHARLKLSDAASSMMSAAKAMRHVDAVLSQLAATIEIDVMPGETDATNCFLPQQPLHPLLLPRCTRQSTVRLVTNPFDFSVGKPSPSHVEGGLTRFLVSSGQNVDDICRQTTLPPVKALQRSMACSCMCPTAPNTLPCYPFINNDPFVHSQLPHVVIAGNQPQFGTELAGGVRYITVPPFSTKGLLVLVDVASPTLDVSTVSFAL